MPTPPASSASPSDVPIGGVPPAQHVWKLTRNCAIAPRTFLLHIGAIGVLMGGVGAAFWIAGYPLVMFFCVCQVVALGVAALVHATHATDGEHVSLEAGRVRVASTRGRHQQVVDFPACWVRLERRASDALLLRSGRAVVSLGEQLTPAQRRRFAEEFAASIARAGRWDASAPAANERPAR